MQKNEVLLLAIESMTNHEDLWQYYCKDLIMHKLRPAHATHGSSKNDIGQLILQNFFEHVYHSSSNSLLERLAKLHCSISMNQLNLDHMAAILRPLSNVRINIYIIII